MPMVSFFNEKKVSLHRLGDSVTVLTSLCEHWALPANTVRCL